MHALLALKGMSGQQLCVCIAGMLDCHFKLNAVADCILS